MSDIIRVQLGAIVTTKTDPCPSPASLVVGTVDEITELFRQRLTRAVDALRDTVFDPQLQQAALLVATPDYKPGQALEIFFQQVGQ